MADDVAARVGEAPDDVEVTRGRGPVHRVRVVAFLADVDVEAAREQQVHDVQMPGLGRQVQQRLFVRRRAQVQPVGVLVEQRRQGRGVAGVDRREHALVHGRRLGVLGHGSYTGERRCVGVGWPGRRCSTCCT